MSHAAGFDHTTIEECLVASKKSRNPRSLAPIRVISYRDSRSYIRYFKLHARSRRVPDGFLQCEIARMRIRNIL
jgi:hypothetical protein